MSDDLTKALESLRSGLPEPRILATEAEKDALVARVGARTARDIVKAKKDFPARRIPFLFSAVDSQAVVDLLANDVGAAIERALTPSRKTPPPDG